MSDAPLLPEGDLAVLPCPLLLLPGWHGSGAAHWQRRWAARWPHARVLEQHDWERPLPGDWCARLEEAVTAATASGALLLVAHSLGCWLVAAWAAHTRHAGRVAGALLVAPPDLSSPTLAARLPLWRRVPRQPLPFAARLVHSENDPYASAGFSRALAAEWGACPESAGALGHLNADSGLGDWPAGQRALHALWRDADARRAPPA